MIRLLRKSVGARLAGLLVLLVLIILGVGALGVAGTAAVKSETMKLASTATNVSLFGAIKLLMTENRCQIMLALQHNPDSPLARLHDHPTDVHLDHMTRNRREIDRLWGEYMKQPLTAEERKLAERYATLRTRYATEGLVAAKEAILAGDHATANLLLLKKINPYYQEALAAASDLEKLYVGGVEAAARSSQAVETEFERTRNLIVGVAFFAGIVATILGMLVARSIARPLVEMVTHASHSVTEDDFTVATPVRGACEIGRTATAFNQLTDKLRQIVREAREFSAQIADTAGRLAVSVKDVTQKVHHQSAATTSVTASVEEISVSLSETAAHARDSEEAVERSRKKSAEALVMTQKTMADVERIAVAIRASTEEVLKLAENSGQISGIVGVIREIADQTNLLALNAAIEAARAGEQGRGFAVVADEVRKLAERTSQSTEEISRLITAIQGQIGGTVEAMHTADAQTAEAVGVARQAGEALRNISGETDEISRRVSDIANAVREQDVAMREIARNVETIAHMTEESGFAISQNDEVASVLDTLAERMHTGIRRYSV